jgi:hypothetical protein
MNYITGFDRRFCVRGGLVLFRFVRCLPQPEACQPTRGLNGQASYKPEQTATLSFHPRKRTLATTRPSETRVIARISRGPVFLECITRQTLLISLMDRNN